MNVDVWMRWGNDMLCVLDAPGRWPDNALDHEVWQEQWGWGRECRRPLQEWGELRQVLAGGGARGTNAGRGSGCASRGQSPPHSRGSSPAWEAGEHRAGGFSRGGILASKTP